MAAKAQTGDQRIGGPEERGNVKINGLKKRFGRPPVYV